MPRKLSGEDLHGLLAAVYGPPPWDLTAQGVAAKLSALRRGEDLPAGIRDLEQRDREQKGRVLAKRLERLLEGSVGQRLFPGQQVPWQETSQGLRARLALLPENPHLELDVRAVSETLGIPPKHLQVGPGDAAWKAKSEPAKPAGIRQRAEDELADEWPSIPKPAKPAAIRQLAEDELAHEWLSIHREAAAQKAFRRRLFYLLRSAVPVAEASAAVDLANAPGPDWLQTVPALDAPGDECGPIDRAIARLIERHRLPPTRAAARRLIRYLLTGNSAWLTGWHLSMALVRTPGESVEPGYDSLTVTVVGLDAFVTREDWIQIWERVVAPRQSLWMRSRGQPEPRGPRGVQIAALTTILPIYRAMVLNNLTVLQALRRLAERGEPPRLDRSTVYRGVRELRLLLDPGP